VCSSAFDAVGWVTGSTSGPLKLAVGFDCWILRTAVGHVTSRRLMLRDCRQSVGFVSSVRTAAVRSWLNTAVENLEMSWNCRYIMEKLGKPIGSGKLPQLT